MTVRGLVFGDLALYRQSDAGVTIDLAAGTAAGGHAEGDTLTGIESVRASHHDDVLTATAGGSTLYGQRGDDVINGGDGNDLLWGGKGDDTLTGGAGFDWLEGGAGADVLNGGDWPDFLGYTLSDAGVTIDLAAGTASGGHAEGDTYSGIESVWGSQHDDSLTGDDGNNLLNGLAGDDTLTGGDGNDDLLGGAGADVIDGGAGNDTARYRSDAGVTIDLAAGTAAGGYAEGDTITGIENIVGSYHADSLRGGGGDNRLEGRGGDDALTGGAGNDTLIGGAGDDTLIGGDDVLAGGDDDNLISGEGGDDVLIGGGGDDTINGGDGDDWLESNAGDDTINGGTGNDTLFGGAGDDRFVFGAGDRVIDFGNGADDRIDLTAMDTINAGNFESEVTIRQNGDDTEIVIGDDVLTLKDINAADLTVDAFLLA